MARVVVATRCYICGAVLRRGQLECSPCVLRLADEGGRAYDAVRARAGSPDPKRERDRLVAEALLWIEYGHARHQVPHVGCAFCTLPA